MVSPSYPDGRSPNLHVRATSDLMDRVGLLLASTGEAECNMEEI